MNSNDGVNRIIVARNGLLGDTLVALPALWALRANFPNANILYLCEAIPGVKSIIAKDILSKTRLVNEFAYIKSFVNLPERMFSFLALYAQLKRIKCDLGIVLEEPHWPSRRKNFLRLCGARIVLGPDGRELRFRRDRVGKLLSVPHIADSLLDILRPLGISLPDKGNGRFDLPASTSDIETVDRWMIEADIHTSRQPVIAVGIWSNMSAKRWPLQRYEYVVHKLICEYNAFPVVLGSSDEAKVGLEFIKRCGRGAVIAGSLSILECIEFLRRCSIYIGNDTGVMHMAACAKIPCVAIFSSRDAPGRWYPYGTIYKVFRRSLPCEGCMLRECISQNMRCMLSVEPDEVANACRNFLNAMLRTNGV
jgi:heptosyltransferase III